MVNKMVNKIQYCGVYIKVQFDSIAICNYHGHAKREISVDCFYLKLNYGNMDFCSASVCDVQKWNNCYEV